MAFVFLNKLCYIRKTFFFFMYNHLLCLNPNTRLSSWPYCLRDMSVENDVIMNVTTELAARRHFLDDKVLKRSHSLQREVKIQRGIQTTTPPWRRLLQPFGTSGGWIVSLWLTHSHMDVLSSDKTFHSQCRFGNLRVPSLLPEQRGTPRCICVKVLLLSSVHTFSQTSSHC